MAAGSRKSKGAKGGVKKAIVVILTGIFLFFAYVLSGYAVCANIPFVTESVALATVNESGSPFDSQQLSQAALAVREYSFGANDQEALYDVVSEINDAAGTPYAGADVGRLMNAPDEYTITADQIDHLDDVYGIARSLVLPIFGVVVITIFLIMVGYRMFGLGAVASSLKISGIAAIAAIGVIALFAVISFQGFFSYFHAVFFDDGTWTFPADSLLIQSLPESFWATMAVIWGATTLLLGILSFVMGSLFNRRLR